MNLLNLQLFLPRHRLCNVRILRLVRSG